MIYVLDFDGVLFDTASEVMAIGYATVKNIDLDPTKVPEKFKDFFRINRSRSNDSAAMFILSKFCVEELEKGKEPYIIDRESFQNIYEAQKDNLKTLGDKISKKRESLVKNFLEDWLKLNKPYKEIWEFVRDKDFYIVSHKDAASIKLLTSTFNKDIDDSKIFSRDQKGSKADKILKIYEKEKQDIIFVDDAINNLIDIKRELNSPLWLTQYLAGWGYIGKEDNEILKSHSDIKFLKNEKELIEIWKSRLSN
ncbi:MAG: hypothetical protein ACOX3T_01040 [Bdellovibrionota bacterium]